VGAPAAQGAAAASRSGTSSSARSRGNAGRPHHPHTSGGVPAADRPDRQSRKCPAPCERRRSGVRRGGARRPPMERQNRSGGARQPRGAPTCAGAPGLHSWSLCRFRWTVAEASAGALKHNPARTSPNRSHRYPARIEAQKARGHLQGGRPVARGHYSARFPGLDSRLIVCFAERTCKADTLLHPPKRRGSQPRRLPFQGVQLTNAGEPKPKFRAQAMRPTRPKKKLRSVPRRCVPSAPSLRSKFRAPKSARPPRFASPTLRNRREAP
jgi:hypothetical protein